MSDLQKALEELMEYTYGMLTTEKYGLQHKIKSMMESADRPTIEAKADEVLTKIYDAVNGINEMVHEVNRPSGEWIHDYHFGLALPEHKCSVCGEWEYSDTESNYCSNCGARMKGADDE